MGIEVIRNLRQLHGLSQQQLADRLGTSQSQVDRLEKGQRGITLEWARRLSRALDVTVEELLRVLASDKEERLFGNPAEHTESLADRWKVVPLRRAKPGDNAATITIGEQTSGWIEKPRGIENNPTVFAFYAPTDSMAPRWRQGELVFVDANLRSVTNFGRTKLVRTGEMPSGAYRFGEFVNYQGLNYEGLGSKFVHQRILNSEMSNWPGFDVAVNLDNATVYQVVEWPDLL